MEVAGPLGTPLGLAQRKRASPRGEAGTSGFPCVSDSERRVPAELGQESQASSCLRKGTPLASRVAQGRVLLFATSWTAAHQASLSFTISQSLLKLMSTESVMPSNHFILCHSNILLPSIFSSIRVFSNESALHIRWPKYWSFSFSISPSNEYSGLISFRIDWFDLLAVQGTLKSLLQHHNLKALILGVQPSLWSNSHIHTRLLEVLALPPL